MSIVTTPPTALIPAIHPYSWSESTLGGPHRAFIALSADLCMGLHALSHQGHDLVMPGRPLSLHDVGELGLSVHRAWDEAAHRIIDFARTEEGIGVRTRRIQKHIGIRLPGLQVSTYGAPPGSWLAHPYPFELLHEHIQGLLGCEPHYLLPREDLLIAFPAGHPRLAEAQRWARRQGPTLPLAALRFDGGFPARVHPDG
ncbi:hypothetical protein L1O03_03865 [Corynebacterium uropygiale]|uniref:Glycogen debranching protein n=1 Tax=Corynebacterium uropygiale TaxID=1775911 RepID=A0A9X1QPA3_9CORY|nr:hypothetical protein [Corynebacterium uropygiale]MCF4006316.1 hypothetical protein [Corynebacterium uropygiale]